MLKGLFIWLFFTAIVYAFKFIFDKKEVINFRTVVIKILFSSIYAFIFVVVLYSLNNISGV